MKRLKEKLHNSKGETLAEVLAAFLICILSVAMLFSGIMASAKINGSAEGTDDDFYEILNAAEQKDTAAGAATAQGKVKVTSEQGLNVNFTVDIYGSDSLYSYKMAAEGGDGTP